VHQPCSGSKDKAILSSLFYRLAVHSKCCANRKPFIDQQEWMAAVKQDADCSAVLGAYIQDAVKISQPDRRR
jgi:hypothetical protein